jgi:hypothetical protein
MPASAGMLATIVMLPIAKAGTKCHQQQKVQKGGGGDNRKTNNNKNISNGIHIPEEGTPSSPSYIVNASNSRGFCQSGNVRKTVP